MSTTENGWTADDPKVDGWYLWRADANDKYPDIASVAAGKFYEIGSRNGTTVENLGGQWLGPFTAQDIEQLAALRKASANAIMYLNTLGGALQYPRNKEAQNVAAALREALGDK